MNSNTETEIVQDKTFETIRSAVNKMVDFVRPTYGPAGNKVIIDKLPYRMVVDDGVQIARDFELSDPAENAVVKVIRETAVKTNDRVGDGTTSSLLILQAIVNEVARKSRRDGRALARELKGAANQAVALLLKQSRKIATKDELRKVAMISFDNEEVAGIIADLYHRLGKDGVITIDKSDTLRIESELTEGVRLDRGYMSPYMITNPERMEAVIEKPYILLTDYRLTEANDIVKIMERMAAAGHRELVVICDNMESHALATAVVNKLQGKFLTVAINTPTMGLENKKVALEDLAVLTGGRVFTESKGDKLETAEIADLGRAERFICRQGESVIVEPKGSKKEVAKAVEALQKAAESAKNDKEKKESTLRAANMLGKIAVIRVGAMTENEQKALKYKVEDTVHAVKAAYRGGVVRGAGLALASLHTTSSILNEALKAPYRQLRENMGLDENPGLPDRKEFAVNYATGENGDFMYVGVADPVDVLIAGIESAVSIASLLLTSSGIIVESQKDESGNNH